MVRPDAEIIANSAVQGVCLRPGKAPLFGVALTLGETALPGGACLLGWACLLGLTPLSHSRPTFLPLSDSFPWPFS